MSFTCIRRMGFTAVPCAALAIITAPSFAVAQDASGVTFTRDVAAILQRSCQMCHRTAPSRRCPS